MASKLEINVQRLLSCAENIALKPSGKGDWRLEKYIATLQAQLLELEKSESGVRDSFKNYSKRIRFLAGILEKRQHAADEPNSPEGSPFVSKAPAPPNAKAMEISLKMQSSEKRNLRKKLFETDSDSEIRQRRASKQDDIAEVLKHHQEMQDQITEDMVGLARHMKERQLLARDIIRNDNAVLTETTKLTDKNYEGIKRETERVQEHTRKCCSCWIWMILFIVSAVFLGMVVFIRIVPKGA
ncbi:vesicle transport protein USE1-like isoform X2 [Oscarella lobularis]|uniref:vesicle transport protein USE1-like isoform X2 n=1 Tax=Oscarella lobularis TaxID=121494 RepID=UPI0033135BDB